MQDPCLAGNIGITVPILWKRTLGPREAKEPGVQGERGSAGHSGRLLSTLLDSLQGKRRGCNGLGEPGFCSPCPGPTAYPVSQKSFHDSPKRSLAIRMRRLDKRGCERCFHLSSESAPSLTDTQAVGGTGEGHASAERNVSSSGNDDGLTVSCFDSLIS